VPINSGRVVKRITISIKTQIWYQLFIGTK
jgi:hypothetical protein